MYIHPEHTSWVPIILLYPSGAANGCSNMKHHLSVENFREVIKTSSFSIKYIYIYIYIYIYKHIYIYIYIYIVLFIL